MTLDLTKPVQTRSGLSVRILATDVCDGTHPVVAAIMEKSGMEAVISVSKEGRWLHSTESALDLVNVPEEITQWVNIYRDGAVHIHPNKTRAKMRGYDGRGEDARIACVPVTFTYTPGEGL